MFLNPNDGFVGESGPRKGEWINYGAFDFAHLIDQRINIMRTGETPEQAADAVVAYGWTPKDLRDAGIKEFKRWQET